MKDLIKKAAGFGASAAFLLATAVTPVAADLTIRGNGASSTSNITVGYLDGGTTSQNNSGNITTNSTNNANTGDNVADENTGGNVTVDTGNATADTTVENVGHLNDNAGDCGCANDTVNALIDTNGASSNNTVGYSRTNVRNRTQGNVGNLLTTNNNTSNTGRNYGRRNTGGNVSIGPTGNANATTNVTNTGHENR